MTANELLYYDALVAIYSIIVGEQDAKLPKGEREWETDEERLARRIQKVRRILQSVFKPKGI